jgi:catechol 2,3-dioxygenase-like lactoylglutathione lyase family enzyme
MFDHTGIATVLGLQTISNSEESFLFGKSKEEPIPYLWIGTTRPSYWVDGSRPGINQMHVAFRADSKAMVEAFYQAALENGGTDNGGPGPRQGAGDYYGAFVLDPDGNNVEACARGSAA